MTEEKVYHATCCGKQVEWEEYLLNHGMCHEHMDKLVEESNERMKDWEEPTC